MIRPKTAQKLCASWHGGQWSALYQFASSGIYVPENHLLYLKELEFNYHSEAFAINSEEFELTKTEEQELEKLINFFIKKGEEIGIETTWQKHHLYDYKMPRAQSNKYQFIQPMYPR